MGGDMLVLATGGVLPAARHRVTSTWDRGSVRFSLIAGLYAADTNTLRPRHFRERVCGLAPWPRCPPAQNARDSRARKLYLDHDQRAERRAGAHAGGGGSAGARAAEAMHTCTHADADLGARVGDARARATDTEAADTTGGAAGAAEAGTGAGAGASSDVPSAREIVDISPFLPGNDPFGCSSARNFPRFKF